MNEFNKYILMFENGALALSNDYLKEMLGRYPWFTTARVILSSQTHISDPQLAPLLSSKPCPVPFYEKVDRTDFNKPSTTDIIDNFLHKGEYKIVPDESTTEEDLSEAGVASVAVKEETLSEELARIYLSQGYKDRALEIYRKLSLLNPEKSIYFAEIIERLTYQQ